MVEYNNDKGRLARMKRFVKQCKRQSEEFQRLAVAADSWHKAAAVAEGRINGRGKKSRLP
jgi:hypothetical protein